MQPRLFNSPREALEESPRESLASKIPTSEKQIQLIIILSLSISIEKLHACMSHREIKFMRKILFNQQEVIENISQKIHDYLLNRKWEIKHIPSLVLMIFDEYKSYCLKKELLDISLEKIILFTMHAMLEYHFLPIDESSHLSEIHDIIQTSLELLKRNMDLSRERKSWFSKFIEDSFLVKKKMHYSED